MLTNWRFPVALIVVGLLALISPAVSFAEPIQSSIDLSDLDSATFSSFLNGQPQPVMSGAGDSFSPLTDGPRHIVWTTTSTPVWDGARFGASNTLGTRYLCIGFTRPLQIGSVLVRGGGALSVLKAGVLYPGKTNVESDWIPATRLSGWTVTTSEVDNETYAVWTLPPGTVTRVLRFSHTPKSSDSTYAGWIGGIELLKARCTDIAPLGQVYTNINNDHASRINDGTNDGTWNAWDNGDTGDSLPVSTAHPSSISIVWPKPVHLIGLCALWAGFDSGEADLLTSNENPRTAPESSWQRLANFDSFQNGYPLGLYPNWIAFDNVVQSRAFRLKITSVTAESHPHLYGKTYSGKRIWLGELMALVPLGNQPLALILTMAPADHLLHPPIPIRFHLDKPGYVTLVIDNPQGVRVRNLVSETSFPAGNDIVWWDGLDDIGRDTEASAHAVYFVPGQLVSPGKYTVRGLVRQQIHLRYLMTAYTNGHPPWQSSSPSSQWLANHTPPQSTLYVPESDTSLTPAGQTTGGLMLVGSYVTEGGSGLAWLSMDGSKKYGTGWIGGNWTGAPFLARDVGSSRVPSTYAYVASSFDNELRLTALTKTGDVALLDPTYAEDKKLTADEQLSGIAVYNGLAVVSLAKENQLLVVDASKHTIVGKLPINDPRGVAFDSHGTLFILSGTTLESTTLPPDHPLAIAPMKTVVSSGLIDPQQVTVDDSGSIYVSDRGNSNQIKVFSPSGSFVRAIGHPGPIAVGLYDPSHMNNPAGVSVDATGRVWVAENSFQPKRVSVWSQNGTLLSAYYGPPLYGGGGEVDPHDPNTFYYCGMKFHLDFANQSSSPVDIYYTPLLSDPVQSPSALSGPQTPIYADGREYLTNAFNSNPTNGASDAAIWLLDHGIARAVAAMGVANNIDLLKTDEFKPDWPVGIDLKGDYWQNQAVFYWSDKNGDGKMEPNEVTILKQTGGGVTVLPDLSFVESRLNGTSMRFQPLGFTSDGCPKYSTVGEPILAGANSPVSTGGDQALSGRDGWSIFTNAPSPFSPYGVGGARNGKALWSYPSLWPGLHASHNAPLPDHPGELLGTTRLLGELIKPRNSDVGQIWAINGNFGNVYLMTTDGLFVATLFKDCRTASWSMPIDQKGMLVDEFSEGAENFWPTITQELDGTVYLTTEVSCISRVDGLSSIKRLPASQITVTPTDLQNAQDYFNLNEERRQQSTDQDTMNVEISTTAPTLDGKAESWNGADWVTIDLRTNQIGDWGHQEQKIIGALRVSGDTLYAAYNTGDAHLLDNAGGSLPLFKTGGALDLMLGSGNSAERLLVTEVAGKTRAVLYRPHDPESQQTPTSFSSPLRTIKFDLVSDISDQVTLNSDGSGFYEYAVPLKLLDLSPVPGATIKGDIGLLRGNGFATLQRVYWRNKSTGLVSDIPSEADLTPNLWGTIMFMQ